MITELIFGGKLRAQVGIVQFDCSVDEKHNDECEVTDHPVEMGSDMSDHIRKRPSSIELHGLVTNTPIVFLASSQAESPLQDSLLPPNPLSSGTRVGDAYIELMRLMDDGETVDVVTSLREYKNMAITNMGVTRDKSTGNVLDATLVLREIAIASTLAIDLPVPKNVANKSKKNTGKKAKAAGSAGQTEKSSSTLFKMFGL